MHGNWLLLCCSDRWQALDGDSVVLEPADWRMRRRGLRTRHSLHPCSDCGDRMHDIGDVIAVRFGPPEPTATACENGNGGGARPAPASEHRQRAQRARQPAGDGDAYHAWYGGATRAITALVPTRAGSGGAARPSTGMPSNDAPPYIPAIARPVHHPGAAAPEALAAPPSAAQRGA
jgi:hypothetical protein